MCICIIVFWGGSVKEDIWGVQKYSEREHIQEAGYFKIKILIWTVVSLWNCVNEHDISYFDLKLCIRTVTV